MSTRIKLGSLLAPDEATDHIQGPASASVTLIAYGDFECPACAQAFAALKIMLPHFGSQLRFVFRHFPLREVHPHAELAAEAAEAAGAQGKFWPMHELLFANPQHLTEKHLLEYAAQLGLDMPRYRNEMSDHVYLQRVQEHVLGGRYLGLQTTPAFYLNGVFARCSSDLKALYEAIDQALVAA